MKKTTKNTKFIALLFIFSLLLPCFLSCSQQGTHQTDNENPPASDDSQNSSPENFIAESGVLGDPELPQEEPEIEKPQNPEKTLYEKSQEDYNGENLGFTGFKLLAEYNKGLDFDLNSFRDYDNKIHYLYLPCRGGDLSSVTFMATHRDGSQSGPYTADFSDNEISENEKTFGTTSVYTLKVLQSDLPSIIFEIDESYGTVDAMNGDAEHETYAYGKMVAMVTDKTAEENGWTTRYESRDEDPTEYCSMKIRGRGNSSWNYSKKPYQFSLENAMNLLGMGRSNKYVLLANYNDATGLRNRLALELGQLLKIEYTSEYCQVDVFMNGQYLGMYLLAEKTEVGENRVEIDRQNDILFEKDNFATSEGHFGWQTDYTNALGHGFRLHYPEELSSIQNARVIIAKAEAALHSSNDERFAQYFDLESFAKMYLLQNFMMNNDAFAGSLYFYYNHEDGKLYACSPWDFDYAFGVSWSVSSNIDPMKFDVKNCEWSRTMIKHENFVRALLDEYYKNGGRQIFQGAYDILLQYIEETHESGSMNAILGKLKYFPSDTVKNYDDAIAYIKSICTNRTQYMESTMANYATKYNYKIA